MLRKPHPHTALAIILGILPLLAVAVIMFLAIRSDQVKQSKKNLTPQGSLATATPTASPVVEPVVEPTVSANSDEVSNEEDGLTLLPGSAKTFLANFYAAYKQKDSERLGEMFTPDQTDEYRSLHARLFTGIDLQGNPGGPTLFSTNSASGYVDGYSLLGAASQDKNWVVTVKENRFSSEGKAVGEQTAIFTITPKNDENSIWLIDSYIHTGASGKYNGFIIQ